MRLRQQWQTLSAAPIAAFYMSGLGSYINGILAPDGPPGYEQWTIQHPTTAASGSATTSAYLTESFGDENTEVDLLQLWTTAYCCIT